jgi:hypothetical protein
LDEPLGDRGLISSGELGCNAIEEADESSFGGGVNCGEIEIAEELDDGVGCADVNGFQDSSVGEAEAFANLFGVFENDVE